MGGALSLLGLPPLPNHYASFEGMRLLDGWRAALARGARPRHDALPMDQYYPMLRAVAQAEPDGGAALRGRLREMKLKAPRPPRSSCKLRATGARPQATSYESRETELEAPRRAS